MYFDIKQTCGLCATQKMLLKARGGCVVSSWNLKITWMWKLYFSLPLPQYKYREAFLRDRGHMIGFFNADGDAHIGHVLRVGKLQSDNLYRSGYAQNRARFQSHLNQPGFLHAKRSQQLASNVNYKQPLHQYTCDPEQLNVKHAKQAYKLQSDVSTTERHSPSQC